MTRNTYLSIITLNVNGLSAPTKRHRLAKWLQKQDIYIYIYTHTYIHTHIYIPYETHFRPKDTYRLKVRGWKKILCANVNRRKTGVAILLSDKIHFKIKSQETKKDTTQWSKDQSKKI